VIKAKMTEAKAMIEEIQVKQIRLAQYNAYSAFLGELNAKLPNLTLYAQVYETLHEYQPTEFMETDVKDILTKLNNLLKLLQNSTEQPKKILIGQLAQDIKIREDELKNAWRKYVTRSTRTSLGFLNSIKGILDDTSKVDQIIAGLIRIQDEWPVSKKVLNDLQDNLVNAQQVIKDLNVREDVRKFLELVSSRQARLTDVTPEILHWLNQQKLTKNLEIMFASHQRRV